MIRAFPASSLVILLLLIVLNASPSVLAQGIATRINCGGPAFTDTKGRAWQADNSVFATSNIHSTQDSIATKEDYDQLLYKTERWDPVGAPELQYSIPVTTAGEYLVRLHFAEIFFATGAVGVRTFGISLEGKVVVSSFDILSQAVHDEAVILNFRVSVSDKFLDIKLLHVTENPKISAIEVSLYTPFVVTFPSIYINAGSSGTITDSKNRKWVGDMSTSAQGIVSYTQSNAHADQSVAITPVEDYDASIYLSERWDPSDGTELTYTFPNLPSAEYLVRLHFAEIFFTAVNQRVFDVFVEGNKVSDNLDLIAKTGGKGKAAIVDWKGLVNDGSLTVGLVREIQNPKISGIEIHQLTGSPTPPSAPTTPPPTTPPPKTPPPSPNPTDAPPNGTPLSFPSLYINAGSSGTITDSKNRKWVGDMSTSAQGIVSYTQSNAYADQSVSITTAEDYDSVIYQSERWDPAGLPELSYTFPNIPSGEYLVRLHFAEIFFGLANQRVFDVFVEGNKVSENLDLVAAGGKGKATIVDWEGTVNDGSLTIELAREVENPKISAIEIHQKSMLNIVFSPLRINVGGKAFTDSNGKEWMDDDFFTDGNVESTTLAIEGVPAKDYPLYQTGRWGEDTVYNFPVPNNMDYVVTMHFADIFGGTQQQGQRVFDVLVEGEVVLTSFDIVAKAGGGYKAFSTADTIYKKVEDGELTIEFKAITENPKISGIEISLVGHRAHAVPGGPYYAVDSDGDGVASVPVDASLSHTHTPFASLVEFRWVWLSDDGPQVVGTQLVTTLTLPVGEHIVRLEVADTEGFDAEEATTIIVKDSTFPFITVMVPSSGKTAGGEEVLIQGSGFVPGQTSVYFGGTKVPAADVKVIDTTTIQILSNPPNLTPEGVDVKVQTPTGFTNVVRFLYFNVPIDWTVGDVLTSIQSPTCVAFGPDGKLYVGTTLGQVHKLTLNDQYQVINSVVSNAANVANPNYPSKDMPLKARAILGITLDPMDTSPNPKVYIAHSFIFHLQFDGFYGKISTLSGSSLSTYKDLVTGLPVSDHDHAVNGIEFGDHGELYIQVGGNTNAGVPGGLSTAGYLQPEEVFSAATVVAYNITKPGFDGVLTYDSKTRDQITGFDVKVFASGQRNPYDIVLHSNGKLYGTDNGPNFGFGKESTGCNTEAPDPSQGDKLNLIQQGEYYGHANRKRGETDPRQCIWRAWSEPSDADYTKQLTQLPSSSNGIIEFESDHFGGDLRGKLLTGQFGGSINYVSLSPDGLSASPPTNLGLEQGGGLNLAQGPDGTIFVSQYTKNKLIRYTPFENPSTALLVKSVFPRRGSQLGGTPLTIYGENFNTYGTPQVTVGGQPCPIFGTITASKLTCTLPPGTGTVYVIVSVPGTVQSDVMVGAYRYIKGGSTTPPFAGINAAMAGPHKDNIFAHDRTTEG